MGRSILSVALALASVTAFADVYVLVDREQVQLNESFTLVLIADEDEQGEPSVAGLERDFEVLSQSQSSSMSIVNGRRETSRRWTFNLVPRALGTFEIPALSVGGVSSDPRTITVTEPVVAPAGDPDVFLEVSLDRTESWVQAQVIYTLKIYRAVSIRQPQLDAMRIEGGEVLVERLGEDRRYEAVIDGRAHEVLERSYALFPQESGAYTIAPAVYRGSLYSRGRISAPQEFRSEALGLFVEPAVPPPSTFPNAVWLPATDLSISATMEPADGMLNEGDPANIVVNTLVRGLAANQLPEFELNLDPALRVYPDKPDYVSRAQPNGVVARRQQSFAIIAGKGGVYDLPTLSIPWFDVDLGDWRLASTPLGTLRAAGQVVGNAPVPEVLDVEPAIEATPSEAPGTSQLDLDRATKLRLFRLKVTNFVLLGLWLATLYVMWRQPLTRRRQRKKNRREAEQNATYHDARKARRIAMQAAQNNDAPGTREAILLWANETLGASAGRGLTAFARHLNKDDAAIVLELDRALYGRARQTWDGAAMVGVLRRLDRPGALTAQKSAVALPPLFPS